MNVKELITELEDCQDKEMEIGYELYPRSGDLELLVGEDGSDKHAKGITITKPEWC